MPMTHPWRPTPAGPFTATQLAQALGLPTPATDSIPLVGVKPLAEAEPHHLTFLDNPAYVQQARTTRAGAIVIHPQQSSVVATAIATLISTQPYADFARALALFYPAPPGSGVHPSAVVSTSAQLGPGVTIGPCAVIGAGVQIGAHTHVGAGVVLAKCTIGSHCILHPGVKVGQDGFGFAQSGKTIIKVPQVGGVIIGNFVEIGANSTVDCGALTDTVIEDFVKIDNLVQIGHNVHIGTGTRIVAQVAIGGSTHIGAHSIIGGQAGIAGHLSLAPGLMVAARSGVIKSIPNPSTVVAGFPAQPIAAWRRTIAALNRLAKKSKASPTDD